jgi:hypothetical protein
MRASASSSLAAGAAAAAAITERLAAPRCGAGDAAAVKDTGRWLPLPKDAKGAGACDEGGGEEEEEVEGRNVGDARTWSSILAAARALFLSWVAFCWCSRRRLPDNVLVSSSDSLVFFRLVFWGWEGLWEEGLGGGGVRASSVAAVEVQRNVM